MRILFFSLIFLVSGCRLEKNPSIAADPASFVEKHPEPEPSSSQPQTIKSKPTWITRSFKDWLQVTCSRSGKSCDPMGRATVLVEFSHNGCRAFRREIDNQAELIQGYASEHQFLMVTAASDALTRALYDTGRSYGPSCRIFLYDDMPKADEKMPNEDQQLVELCKDATVVAEGECRSELSHKKLYAP